MSANSIAFAPRRRSVRVFNVMYRLVGVEHRRTKPNDSAHGVYPRFDELETWWSEVTGKPKTEVQRSA